MTIIEVYGNPKVLMFCDWTYCIMMMDLNITINNNEGSILYDFSTPVTKKYFVPLFELQL
jgi:hypothetical protein